MARGLVLAIVVAFVALLFGCTRARQPIAIPRDGSTQVVFETHLPTGFRVTSIQLTMDGEPIQVTAAPATIGATENTSIFHKRIPEGAHSIQLVCEVVVPCGLAAEPYEKLTATIARSFEVGQSGGLVHIDAFAQSASLNPAERVHILVSLRGMREGRWLYGQSKEAKQACGRLGRLERSRCIVQRLADRSRAQHDVAGLLCQKDKLETIDDLIASLEPVKVTATNPGVDLDQRTQTQAQASAALERQHRAEAEVRVEQLEREAEYCVGEDLSWMPEQQVTSDRSACARYDEPTTP